LVSLVVLAAVARAGMPPLPVIVAPAERGEVRSVLPSVGTVQGVRDVSVGSKLAERVAEVLVDEGDQVVQDETILCKLDVTNTELDIQEAQARLKEVQALLDKAIAGPRPQEIRQAEAELRGFEARVEKLDADVRRNKKLLDNGVISRAEYDAVVAEHDIAKAQVDGAEAKLEELKEGTRTEDIAKARADLALRQAELDMALQRKEDSVVKSPVDGSVVRKLVEVGEWTQIGGTVMEVVDTSKLRVHTTVTEKTIRRIQTGMDVRVHLDAYPDEVFHGAVYRIVPKADPTTRSFPVQVDILEPKEKVAELVKPGMFARCEFIVGTREDVLLVPEDAVVYRAGLALVFTASPRPPQGAGGPPAGAPGEQGAPKGTEQPPAKGKGGPDGPPMPGPPLWASRVVVKTGARQEGKIEITEVVNGALQAGDLVVTVGNENMHQGAMMIVVGGLPEGRGAAPPGGAPGTRSGDPPTGAASKEQAPR
jgi:multidrug efflux pump subunit AcrA (membrane-fusion protein)